MAQMNSRIERNKLGKTHLTVNDERYTPKSVIDYFNRGYHIKFDYDPATTTEKAKEFGIPNFDTIETDGLAQDWTEYKKIWINPPFSLKPEFLKKAVETSHKAYSDIYFLCPIEYLTTAQFSDIIAGCHIYIPTGRISFINGKPGGKNGKSPAFGSVIVRLYPNRMGYTRTVEFVDIKKLRAQPNKDQPPIIERELG